MIFSHYVSHIHAHGNHRCNLLVAYLFLKITDLVDVQLGMYKILADNNKVIDYICLFFTVAGLHNR